MSAIVRLVAWLLAVALVALPVVALLNGWWGSERWPLSRLRVSGTFERVEPVQLQAALAPHARRGFFAVDLAAAKRSIEALPWVERADVRKRWPDVLDVRIAEHRPVARWGAGRLLSDRGRLFPARGDTVPAGLPRLDGPDARVPEVVALYNESRALFATLGVQVRRVSLDARGSWTLELDNGADVVVGRTDARARLARFARLMPQLLDRRMQPLARADLRYTNGFALVWGEKPGLGIRESGLGTARQPRINDGPRASVLPLSRISNPQSQIPALHT